MSITFLLAFECSPKLKKKRLLRTPTGLAHGKSQFSGAAAVFLSNFAPDFFESWEFHVALDAFDPLIPGLVGDSLLRYYAARLSSKVVVACFLTNLICCQVRMTRTPLGKRRWT